MPQLMPLYWIMSSFMSIFLLIMILKIYGNNMLSMEFIYNISSLENNKKEWYW